MDDLVSSPLTRLSVMISELFTEQFAKKLLGDSEIENILRWLDQLTQDKARMMEAHILEVVHCLMNNMKVLMDGEENLTLFRASNQVVVCTGSEASSIAIRKTLGMFKYDI